MAWKDIPFIGGLFNRDPVSSSLNVKDLAALIGELKENIAYKKYAVQLCINKITSALALCVFETYKEGKEHKDYYWWRLNFEPSVNTNLNDFLYQIVYQMVYNDDGALVVQSDDGQLVVAKSYSVQPNALFGNVYYNVEVYGDYKFGRSFKESDVLRFQLPNRRIQKLVNSIYDDYGKLMSATMEAYIRERTLNLVLNIQAMFDQKYGSEDEEGESESDAILDELFEARFKGLFDLKNSVTPLEEGLELSQLKFDRSESSVKDIKEILGSLVDLAADAFGIPRGLLKGDVADVEAMTDNFITFAIRPIAKELETEINRKLYGKEQVQDGTKVKIVTHTIATYNVVSFAAAADKLIAATIGTPNEMRRVLGWEPSDDPKLDEFKETKNYITLKAVDE